MKRMVTALALLLALGMLAGCGSGWGEPAARERTEGGFSFWLTGDGSMTFSEPGEQAVITYHMNPRDIPITWESTDESVAVVGENCVVTAVGPGTCEIRYTAGYEEIGIMEGRVLVTCDWK